MALSSIVFLCLLHVDTLSIVPGSGLNFSVADGGAKIAANFAYGIPNPLVNLKYVVATVRPHGALLLVAHLLPSCSGTGTAKIAVSKLSVQLQVPLTLCFSLSLSAMCMCGGACASFGFVLTTPLLLCSWAPRPIRRATR